MQKCVLNEFERKSILRNFNKEFNVIGFVPHFHNEGMVNYTFFFERGGYIFNTNVFFSSRLYNEVRPDVSKFISYLKDILVENIKEIDRYLLSETLLPDISYVVYAVKIKSILADCNRGFFNSGIIEHLLSDKDLDFARDFAEDLLLNSSSPRDVFPQFYGKYKATSELTEKIDNLMKIDYETA